MSGPHNRDAIPRVLLVSHNSQMGGAEAFLVKMIREVSLDGVDFRVMLAQDGPLARELRKIPNIHVEVTPLDSRFGTISKSSGWRGVLRAIVMLRQILVASRCVAAAARGHQRAIVHTYSMKADFYGALGARMAGSRCVMHLHDVLSKEQFPWVYRKAVVLAANLLAELVVCSSGAVRDAFTAEGGKERRSVVLEYGIELPPVDPSAGGALRRELGIHEKDPIVALVGRIAHWKGQDIFIRAAELVIRAHFSCRFLIVGSSMFGSQDEEYERSIRQLVSDRRLSGNVIFTGFRSDVGKIMAGVDIVVSCSRAPEAGPLVLMEAMAAGTSVIATHLGNVPWLVVPDVTGTMVKPEAPVELAAAIAAQLEAPPGEMERLGSAGRRVAEQRFDIGTRAKEFARLYRELSASGGLRS